MQCCKPVKSRVAQQMICKKIVNSFWMRLSKILCFVIGEQINYLASANN